MNAQFPAFYKYLDAQQNSHQVVTESMKQRLNNDLILIEKLFPNSNWDAGGNVQSLPRCHGVMLTCFSVTLGHGHLEALTQPNTSVVTSGIQKIVANGLIINDGELHEVDAIVAATGYDTSFIPRFPILVLNKQNLQDKWREEGAAAYLSVAVRRYAN
ncbi:hypothetical protein BKA63DRAFT_566590 [Paraphoma chrysanthemicola]|nr:hypothetical protein BKA63DRAFT_566590 [Paraphoma chrysanthemicola]